MDCFVDCGGINGCKNATINGPIGYNLIVECGDNNSCSWTHINGENSSGLNVTCKDNDACTDNIVDCPSNTDAPCFVNIPDTSIQS